MCVCWYIGWVAMQAAGRAGRGGLWPRLQCWSDLEHYLVVQHREYYNRGLVSSIRRNLITLLKI